MDTLVLRGFAGAPEITQSAIELRNKALSSASKIQSVLNEDELSIAVEALRALKEIRSGLELTRKSIKKPVIDLGRKIDSIAADYLEDVLKSEGRLSGLVNHFQRKKLEEQRVEAERIEREKREAEALAVKAKAESDPDKRTALEQQALDKSLEAEMSGVVAVAKPKGLVVREKVNFKVTDAIVFVQAYPQFFRWNAEHEYLKLDRMRVLDELNREDGKGVFHQTHFPEELPPVDRPSFVNPPGMNIFAEVKSHVR